MTDNEIKKGLRILQKEILGVSVFVAGMNRTRELHTLSIETLDLINRLQAEKSALVEHLKKARRQLKTAKAEAYKRCIENAKEELYEWVGTDNSIPYTRIKKVLDNLLKEMVGEDK